MSNQTYPLLAVTVGKIIDSLGIPLLSDAEQIQGQKSILSHDDEVDEETGRRLDHADLAVRHRNKPTDADRRVQVRSSHGINEIDVESRGVPHFLPK